MSAIDIALYDCLGKKLGVPVYQLLGGAHRHHVPCFVSCAAEVPAPQMLTELTENHLRFICGGHIHGSDICHVHAEFDWSSNASNLRAQI